MNSIEIRKSSRLALKQTSLPIHGVSQPRLDVAKISVGKSKLSLPNGQNFGSFTCIKLLGGGSFGKVYRAIKDGSDGHYALKTESKSDQPLLPQEANMLETLVKIKGVAQFVDFFKTEHCYVLVMSLCGRNLKSIDPWDLKQISLLAIRMLHILEAVHARGLIHRDIKPENICFSDHNDKIEEVVLVDFGLASLFRFSISRKKTRSGATGTREYMSLGAMHGFEPSPFDDIESLVYVLVRLHQTKLPWTECETAGIPLDQADTNLLAQKASLTPDKICSGLPKCFSQLLRSARRSNRRDKPQYQHYRDLFQQQLDTGTSSVIGMQLRRKTDAMADKENIAPISRKRRHDGE